MRAVGCEAIERVLLTHRHYDHVGGAAALTADPALRARRDDGPIPCHKCVRDASDPRWRKYRYARRRATPRARRRGDRISGIYTCIFSRASWRCTRSARALSNRRYNALLDGAPRDVCPTITAAAPSWRPIADGEAFLRRRSSQARDLAGCS